MDENKKNSPGHTANKRLFDARTHWVRALESYFSPDEFRIEINACIQALRNTTFALQADKASIPNFDKWYSSWQNKMRADQKMKWSVEARNTIVKARDLELNSKLRVSIVGSYLDREIPKFQMEYSPEVTTKAILDEIKSKDIPDAYVKNSQLKIERRWVINDFPDLEFLALLSHCWTFLSRILADLPNSATGATSNDGWGLPPCMVDDGEYRSVWIRTSTGEVSVLDMNQSTSISKEELDPVLKSKISKKYGLDSLHPGPPTGDKLRDLATIFFKMAKKALVTDGYHMFLVMLFTRSNNAFFLDLRPEDRSDKYRMWHAIASEVRRTRASSLICISEAWTAQIPFGKPFQHAADAPDREEALNLIAASENGSGFMLSAPFTRVNGEIVIQPEVEHDLDRVNLIAPVVDIWKEMAKERRIGD